ncbi:NADH-quinone oxidoreductase subunit J [Mesobacillus sp. AQ2]|uniref:NADH-quinone oxidoreductase subunit J n=1 Tax=Bacillaceae TaxID=186817 RepID=UPI0011A7A767|nr:MULTISPECIES: NADH-quinone oxidoreductase subunit J [Bacillaceae]MBT2703627.1 NADH-quinone oxidoreductase subunit J [Chryseobacterium sp. ISL-80]MBT2678635.1 NADH-quinone oxidoreductase subunit J [Bacillus sp. ISL-35]MCM3123774.1 NADH-quinone oxidoreductase subunit J [Mesobacillus sp. MER 33]MCM3234211.1 NADH-quinone oxidoreductase subunit J [Mesobacillus sp. MER 48]WHX40458.1 NADH-quinone oxidoreductase subunit J [Mesobacillus sp. AQ2]
MTLTGEFFAFMSLALVAVIGGVLLLNLTKVIHMVVALVFTFVSIAGIYVLLSAEFLAVIQVMIYSGAITIMMLFGIMLTRHHGDEEEPKGGRLRKLVLLLGVLGFGAAVYFGIYDLDFEALPNTLHENNTEQIGVALYSHYIIPFELTSVILLAALVGAIVLARKDDDKEGDQE